MATMSALRELAVSSFRTCGEWQLSGNAVEKLAIEVAA